MNDSAPRPEPRRSPFRGAVRPVADLPRATADLPRPSGRIRVAVEDFAVDEIPAYPPSGGGTHRFVRFRKRDLTTREAVERLARALGADPRAAGTAGLKDRRAVTTQWASFENVDATRFDALDIEGVEVLDHQAHEHKLRIGHLRGNRFVLRVKDAGSGRSAVESGLRRLAEVGAPNYFGPQRFGRDERNLDRALHWLVDGGRPPRAKRDRKFGVSVLQAALFNELTARRLEDERLGEPLPGDLLQKEGGGGLFVETDYDAAVRRCREWEVSPTGPMFGSKMRRPEGLADEAERALLSEAGLDEAALRRFGRDGRGTRRPLRVRPVAPSLEVEGDDLILAFTLPKGCFATVILRELVDLPGDVE